MLPPVRPIRDSMSGGPSTSCSTRHSLEAGGEAVDQVDELPGDLVARESQVALRELVRRVLAEDAQQVLSLRRGLGS